MSSSAMKREIRAEPATDSPQAQVESPVDVILKLEARIRAKRSFPSIREKELGQPLLADQETSRELVQARDQIREQGEKILALNEELRALRQENYEQFQEHIEYVALEAVVSEQAWQAIKENRDLQTQLAGERQSHDATKAKLIKARKEVTEQYNQLMKFEQKIAMLRPAAQQGKRGMRQDLDPDGIIGDLSGEDFDERWTKIEIDNPVPLLGQPERVPVPARLTIDAIDYAFLDEIAGLGDTAQEVNTGGRPDLATGSASRIDTASDTGGASGTSRASKRTRDNILAEIESDDHPTQHSPLKRRPSPSPIKTPPARNHRPFFTDYESEIESDGWYAEEKELYQWGEDHIVPHPETGSREVFYTGRPRF